MSIRPPRRVNHVAYASRDTKATRDFYTDVLGLELVAAVQEDRVPSTGEETPFLHTFFALGDGTCIAFFDVAGLDPADHAATMPRWIQHLALDVDSLEELVEFQERLERHGVETIGIVNHEDIWQSVYFFDPNGVRLEVTYQARDLTPADAASAREAVGDWIDR